MNFRWFLVMTVVLRELLLDVPCICLVKAGELHRHTSLIQDDQHFVEFNSESNSNVASLLTLENERQKTLHNSITSGSNHSKIIGGNVVHPPKNYPWITTIWRARNGLLIDMICGGTLISRNVVVTAAHCKIANPKYDHVVQIGRYDLTNSEQEYDEFAVQNIIQHEYFDDRNNDYDVMLLVLDCPSSKKRVEMDLTTSEFGNNTELISMGFGVTDTQSYESSDILLEVSLFSLTSVACQNIYESENITQRMLCAWDNDINVRKDTCWGDSGGPLVERTENGMALVGIVSWGYGCASKTYPGVYTRLFSLREWILSKLCVYSSDEFGTCSPTTTPTILPSSPSPLIGYSPNQRSKRNGLRTSSKSNSKKGFKSSERRSSKQSKCYSKRSRAKIK